MKQSRLDQLADGIFAIVMTIMVFEIRVPDLGAFATNQDIFGALHAMSPVFLSYMLSFSLLFTYWRAHHFIASVYAKSIDVKLTNINAIFFFFVALIPFSSQLLGKYHNTQAAILLFAANVILIGLSLFWMRHYVHHSNTIENMDESATAHRHANIRTLFPVLCALVASYVCFYNTELALVVFTLGIFFNLIRSSTIMIDKVLKIEDLNKK